MRRRGFTLIELLVVVAIIGLMSSIIVASLNTARTKAKYTAAKQLDANFYHNLGDSLVGQWLFDECGGTTAKDTSGMGNDGTLAAGASFSTDTPFGVGCALSNSGGHITIPDAPSLDITTGVTMAVWAKINSVSAGQVISKYDSVTSNDPYEVQFWNDGNIYGNFYTTGGVIGNMSCPYVTNTWIFIIATYDGKMGRLYISGAQCNAKNQIGSLMANTKSVYIGASGSSTPFPGLIDSVRIYDRALDTAEVQKLYTEEAPRHGIAVK